MWGGTCYSDKVIKEGLTEEVAFDPRDSEEEMGPGMGSRGRAFWAERLANA